MRKKKSGETNKQNIFLKFFLDERLRIITGITLVLFSSYIMLALVSYIFTWETDQNIAEWNNLLSGTGISENWSGNAGAFFSFILINKWFGLASFLIPLISGIIGIRFLGISVPSLNKALVILVLSTILLSVIFGFLFFDSEYLGGSAGGGHGYHITQWLVSLIGKIGTAFVLFILSFSLIIYSSYELYRYIKNLVKPGIVDTKEPESERITEPETDFEIDSDNNGLVLEVNKPDEDLLIVPPTVIKETPPAEKESSTIEPYDPTLDLSSYVFPKPELLDEHNSEKKEVTEEELKSNTDKIISTLKNYDIQIDKIKATVGPTVTLYEVVPAAGVRVAKIKNLEDDIALSLAALGIRIIAPIPGKGTVGIEVPNQNPDIVSMRTLISSPKFQDTKFDLPIALGKTISNETFIFDLAKMPHLLVAGATGQGKSVGLNAILTSLLYKKHPSELKLILIDPKKVELTLYSKLEKYFLAMLPDADEPIITDTKKVIRTLNSLTILMEERYNLLKAAEVRNVKEYNAKFKRRVLNPEHGHKFMPYIVVIIDEFADFIITAGREVEVPLTRLAQMARAVGIHLVIATQRPTTNIITGTIKANFPARIAFKVSSGIDSKTIIDTPGANQLVGRGDLLITANSDLIRLQCAFIDIPEVERITDFISKQQSYTSAYMLPDVPDESSSGEAADFDPDKRDDLFEEAARLIVQNQQGSTSLIQRKFSIGYNRAGRIVDQLQAAGIVGPFEGSKARQVLFSDEYSLEQYLNSIR